jgi:beta-lysine N6-acetyltransferase
MDTETRVGASLIQHGSFSDRVYLMKLDRSDYPDIVDKLDSLAHKNSYGKIFAKVPENCSGAFIDDGFEEEARIPSFYPNEEDVVFLSKFFEPERRVDDEAELAEVLKSCKNPSEEKNLPKGFTIRILSEKDAEDLAVLYLKVFKTYPFPIENPAYLRKNMGSTKYFGVFYMGILVSAASLDMNKEEKSAEMTDFATLKDYTSRGLASNLLEFMETFAEKIGLRTLYTIARSRSFGMNKVFAKRGYEFAGTLINNTQIAGDIESMNVWYKRC